MRRVRTVENTWTGVLAAIAVLVGLGLVNDLPAVTASALAIPIVIGNIILSPRTLPWFVVFALGVLVLAVAATPEALDQRRVGGVIVTFVVGLIVLVSSFRRSRLGVAGALGESMLVDLRERINKQGILPALSEPWYAEQVTRSAEIS